MTTWNIRVALAAAVCLPAATGAWQQYPVNDPVLGMTAWTVALPASWTAEGTMLPGSACNASTTPVVRATSPDGSAGMYFLPRTDWVWGAGTRPSRDCLPWRRAVSAKEFLAYQMRIEKVGFVRDVPVDAGAPVHPGQTMDAARALVRYSVKGRLVDEQMTARVTCTTTAMAVVGDQHACSAFVTRWFAPSAKLDAMLPTSRAIKFSLDQQWWSAWQSALAERFARLTDEQSQRLLESGRLAGAERMRAHDAYMSSTQSAYAEHNATWAAGMYTKQRNSDNFVDYVLDCSRAYAGNVRVSAGNCPNRQTF